MFEHTPGGSRTALLVFGTQAGNSSAYLPPRAISIFGGKTVKETEPSRMGFRTAMDMGLSVIRGGRNE